MPPVMLAGVIIAAAGSAGVTIAFVLVVRLAWRRGKQLQDP